MVEDYEKSLRYRLLSYHSYVFWTQVFEKYSDSPYKKFWYNHDLAGYWRAVKGTCPFCDNLGVFDPTSDEQPAVVAEMNIYVVNCLCTSLETLAKDAPKEWESSIDYNARLNQILSIDIPPGAAEQTTKNVNIVSNWLKKPTKWMLLTGGTGTAKSHVLFAVRRALGGYGFYITASDLVQSLLAAVKTGETDELLHRLIHAPFLLVDDFGMEHKSAGGYGLNLFTHVLDQRYLLKEKAPVVVATNLSLEQLQDHEDMNMVRAGSRLMDSDLSKVLLFTQADFRLKTTKAGVR